MNGRVYDANIGRFMSVDPVFQAPRNSQSVNPYSYVMNNPLSLVDPSGYEAASLNQIADIPSGTTSVLFDTTGGGIGGEGSERDAKGNLISADIATLNAWVKQQFGEGASIFGMGSGADSDGNAWMVITGGNGKNPAQGSGVPSGAINAAGSGEIGNAMGAAKLVNNDGHGNLSLTAAGATLSRAAGDLLPLGERGDPESYINISANGVLSPIHTCADNGKCTVEGLNEAVISVHSHQYQLDGGPAADQGRNIWPGSKDQNMAVFNGVINVYRGADGKTMGAIGLSNGEPYLTMLPPSTHASSWMARQWNNLMRRWQPNVNDPMNSIGVSDDQVAELAKEFANDPTRP